MEQVHVFISGSVQGVGYRQFVRGLARRNGLTGWVSNLADGRVEAVLQGDTSLIEEVLEKLKKGPFLAEVSDLRVSLEDPVEQFSDFIVVA